MDTKAMRAALYEAHEELQDALHGVSVTATPGVRVAMALIEHVAYQMRDRTEELANDAETQERLNLPRSRP